MSNLRSRGFFPSLAESKTPTRPALEDSIIADKKAIENTCLDLYLENGNHADKFTGQLAHSLSHYLRYPTEDNKQKVIHLLNKEIPSWQTPYKKIVTDKFLHEIQRKENKTRIAENIRKHREEVKKAKLVSSSLGMLAPPPVAIVAPDISDEMKSFLETRAVFGSS